MSVEHDEYSGLSAAELEAIKLNDDGSEPEPEEVTEEIPVEDVADEPADAPEPVDDEPADEPEVVLDESPVAAPETEVAFAPQFQAQGVENFKEVVAGLDTEYDGRIDALAAKYESGELSFSDYRKEERALTRQYEDVRQRLHETNLKAEIAAEHSRQSAAQKWELEQNLFFADSPDYRTDPILRGALSAQLEQLYADEKNAGKPGIWFLREAGKAIDERFNRVAAAPKADSSKLKAAEESLRRRQARHPEIPKTLAQVPAAEANDEGGNEFAYLDKLEGLAYERALAKLSDGERDRYMAA